MIKIRIWADTHSTGIFTEIGEYLNKEETSISDETWKKLQKWVQDYDFIIPLSLEDRIKYTSEIAELDSRGLKLTQDIASQWKFDSQSNEPIHFEYYSEGEMKVLYLS